ncbi:MAG: hypothetical protein L6Q97_22265 [Thermoanaerobaculia bacterium]|nr:hypothetical protein [Thermoanaerobaculia bacterium]
MRAKVFSALMFLGFIFLTDYGYFKLNLAFGNKVLFDLSFFLLTTIFVFIFFSNLLYKTFFSFADPAWKVVLCMALPLAVAMLYSDRMLAINKFYFYSKNLPKKSSGNLWRPDPVFAHRGVPNAQGSYNYYIGDSIKGSIEVTFDNQGFRTVPDTLKVKSDTTNLFLGCSFTFGDYILAEEGYPYKTSVLLRHHFVNGGASAYGIAQMKLLLDSLLSQKKFHYVFIQFSPWHLERAMKINGPSFYGYRPFPYFSEHDAGFQLNMPAYKTNLYVSKDWHHSGYSYRENLYFKISDGWQIEIQDFFSYNTARCKILLGLIPKPTKNRSALERYFYSYVLSVCSKNNTIPVFLKLAYPIEECRDLVEYLDEKSILIDLDAELDAEVEKTGKTYDELFHIYHKLGETKLYYDAHPNAYANDIIAKKIYADLRRN